MQTKLLEHCFRETYLCTGGVSFNTNDQLIATGNSNGDITVRNIEKSDTQTQKYLKDEPAVNRECILTH